MDIAANIVKFNAQTSGRDKLCRLFQYISKLGWWELEILKKDPQLVKKLKNLETTLSATRKVLRIGKSVDMVQGAVKSMQLEDIFYRLTLTLSKLTQACYLFVDHILWVGKVGLVNTNTKKWAKASARFWLITIIFNLIRNMYDVVLIAGWARWEVVKRKTSSSSKVSEAIYPWTSLAAKKPVVLDIVKNVCDLFLPLSSLGYIQTSVGFQGVMGIISSLVGVMVVWKPVLKLVPS